MKKTDLLTILNEFQYICGLYCIEPSIAAENEAVKLAIKSGDLDALRKAIETEF